MGKHFKPEKTYIYLLRCPIDNSPKYVGKSNDPNKRKDCHKSKSKTKDNPLSKWIRELNENNLKPIVEIIEEVDYPKWIEREKFYVKKYREEGHDLKNVNNGSNGLSGPNQTSFKKGRIHPNKGTGKPFSKICPECGNEFKLTQSGLLKYTCCSSKCGHRFRLRETDTVGFCKSKPILQIVPESMEVLKEFKFSTDAAKEMGVKAAAIRFQANKKKKDLFLGFFWFKKEDYESN